MKEFRTLLEERSFEQISVTDICEEATINRTTFYKHFESKYDLLSYGLRCDQAIAQKKWRQIKSAEELEQEAARFLGEIASDRHYYKRLLVDKEDQWLSTLLRRQTAEKVEMLLTNAQKHGRRFTIPLTVIAQFYAGARLALVTWWLENEGLISPEELAHYWHSLSQGEVPLPNVEPQSSQTEEAQRRLKSH
jgi:AcrR family transcriptional regulator